MAEPAGGGLNSFLAEQRSLHLHIPLPPTHVRPVAPAYILFAPSHLSDSIYIEKKIYYRGSKPITRGGGSTVGEAGLLWYSIQNSLRVYTTALYTYWSFYCCLSGHHASRLGDAAVFALHLPSTYMHESLFLCASAQY